MRGEGEGGALAKLAFALALAIVAAVGSLAYLKFSEPPESLAEYERAKMKVVADLATLKAGLVAFKMSKGRYPARLKELSPEFVPSLPLDPWGRDYHLDPLSDGRVRLGCYGKDGVAGKRPWFDFSTLDVYLEVGE